VRFQAIRICKRIVSKTDTGLFWTCIFQNENRSAPGKTKKTADLARVPRTEPYFFLLWGIGLSLPSGLVPKDWGQTDSIHGQHSRPAPVNGNPPDSFTQSLELVTYESCGGTCPNVVSGLSDPRRVPSDTGKTRGSALMRGHKRRGCAERPRLRPSPGCDAAAQAATRARVAAVASPAGRAPAGACEMREKSGPVPRRCQAAGWWRFNTMRRRCKSKVNRSRESNTDDTSRLSSGCGGAPGLVRSAGLGRGVVAHRRALARVRRAVG